MWEKMGPEIDKMQKNRLAVGDAEDSEFYCCSANASSKSVGEVGAACRSWRINTPYRYTSFRIEKISGWQINKTVGN